MCGGPRARKCCVPPGVFNVSLGHFVLQTFLLVLIILANVTVVLVTALDPDLHTATNIGITSLALADLLLGLSWFYIQVLVFQHGTMITNIHPAYRYLQDLAYVFEMSVILHILLVTVERFLAVVWPLWHFRMTRSGSLPVRIILASCLAVWVLAAFLAHTRRFTGEWLKCEVMVGMTLLRSILPLLLTAVLNILILVKIRQNDLARMKLTQQKDEGSSCVTVNRRALTTIGRVDHWRGQRFRDSDTTIAGA